MIHTSDSLCSRQHASAIRVATLAIALALGLCASGSAHDLWLVPERFTYEPGDTLVLRLVVGHDFEAEQQLALTTPSTISLQLIEPQGPVDLLTSSQSGAQAAVKRKIDFTGLALIAMQRGFIQTELSADVFSQHLAHEELHGISNLRERRGTKPTEIERYTRSLYTLIDSGKVRPAKYRQIEDAELRRLRGMSNVTALDFGGTLISDTGLAHIGDLTDLRTLDLSGTPITDEGLKHLQGLNKLRTLNLFGTQISDAALPHLAELPNLRRLQLGNTQVTQGAASRLQSVRDFSILFDHDHKTYDSISTFQLLGPKLQVRLLQNPYQLKPGASLSVRVWFDGEALSGQTVWAYNRHGNKSAKTKTTTDQNGVATFRLNQGGPWLIRLVHMIPCELAGVDWESYWATYTFEL